MALNIKNERVHELAREAARRSGTTQTSALETALERYVATLDEPTSDDRRDIKRARAREIVTLIQRSLSEEDREGMRRHLDEMYDDDGLPV